MLRLNKSLTQGQLAALLEVDQTAVSQWETGVSAPRSDKLPELARILGCTIDELFNEKGEE
jgi:transcriptional regulator with XRE-family HTH domain